VVKDPVGLANNLRRLILLALGETEESIRSIASSTGPPPVVKKRKIASLSPVPQSGHPQFRNWVPPKDAGIKNENADIIERSSTPVSKATKREVRVDSSSNQTAEAEVQTSKMSTSVVRRSIENGVVIIETRTIHTIVERVRFEPLGILSSDVCTLPPS
jgi:hypothetical protein